MGQDQRKQEEWFLGGQTTVKVGNTEEYDGSNWTAGGTMNTAREGLTGSGSNTLGLAFGGYTTTNVANSEEYNGTSWTEGPDLSTARRFFSRKRWRNSSCGFSFWRFCFK